ncbi:MAG: hypothetical protein QOE97_2493 [Pseudonocardiales bacterium]|nr:hypothetical protein [Pseudonocardiales bacterium]
MEWVPDESTPVGHDNPGMIDDDSADAVIRLIETGRDREAARRGVQTLREVDPLPLPEGETMDPLDQLGQLTPLLTEVVAGIRRDQLDDPTPCTDFTVRGVLEHMIGGATMFAAAYRGRTPQPPDLDDVLDRFDPALQDLGAALNSPGALRTTIDTPFGAMAGEHFARYIVLDGLMHGWDMANATGQSYEPPAALVAAADSYARETLEAMRDGSAFGAAVDPAPDAAPIERLAAYTGRRPVRVVR